MDLVGGFNTSEKYESQLGWLFPIYGKIKKCSKPPTSMGILLPQQNWRMSLKPQCIWLTCRTHEDRPVNLHLWTVSSHTIFSCWSSLSWQTSSTSRLPCEFCQEPTWMSMQEIVIIFSGLICQWMFATPTICAQNLSKLACCSSISSFNVACAFEICWTPCCGPADSHEKNIQSMLLCLHCRMIFIHSGQLCLQLKNDVELMSKVMPNVKGIHMHLGQIRTNSLAKMRAFWIMDLHPKNKHSPSIHPSHPNLP